MTLPPEATRILRTLEAAGFEAFVVGGCVRDAVRGIAPKDWDITTSAHPPQVKALFPRTFDTGIAHGTITVLENRRPFEVTTYRIDGAYTDARRPDSVLFTGKIEEDLSRRDFTMNAIAYNPAQGFADPFGGRADIEAKIIRAVGDPMLRFGEDALRMLRAMRFAATLGFTIEPATLAAMHHQAANLRHISAERIREELTRTVCGTHPQALYILEETQLRPYPADLKKTVSYLEKCPADPLLRLALYFAPLENPADQLRALRYDNKTTQAVALFTRLLPHPIPADAYEVKKILRQFPVDTAQQSFYDLITLQEITHAIETAHALELRQINTSIHANRECYTLKTLAVTGRDLAAHGIPEGKEMGRILASLLDTVLRDPAQNTAPSLLSQVKT